LTNGFDLGIFVLSSNKGNRMTTHTNVMIQWTEASTPYRIYNDIGFPFAGKPFTYNENDEANYAKKLIVGKKSTLVIWENGTSARFPNRPIKIVGTY
jgi:hypothetical protein